MRGWLGRLGLYALGIAFVAAGIFGLAQTTLLSGPGGGPTERAIKPAASEKTLPKPVEESASVERVDKEEPEEIEKEPQEKKPKEEKPEQELEQVEAAIEEPDPVPTSVSASASASASAPASSSASPSASSTTPENAVAPADTTMYLTVPKMGIYDIPVVEGTEEASLSVGAGHYVGSGYPWVAGSNTYIAGHRVGYPGTASDHVFYNLPNLVAGDEVIITDSAGQTYTYAVSEILEVPITDLSVTAPTGGDVVSLQTCIEDFGDYWTMGPNWNVRYVVRAERVA
jgi:sortase A